MNMMQSMNSTNSTTLLDNNKQKVFCIYYKHQQVLLYIIMYIHTINTLNIILHTLQNTLQDSIYTLCQQANSVSTINNISLASQYYLKVILHIYTSLYTPNQYHYQVHVYTKYITYIFTTCYCKSISIICILMITISKNISRLSHNLLIQN